MENKIDITLLSKNATIPKRHLEGAGLDIFSAHEVLIQPFSTTLIRTDVALTIPKNHTGLIMGRSGISLHSNLIIHLGVIDEDFRGNVGIIVHNLNKEQVVIHKSKKIAQILIMPIIKPEINIKQALEPTERGSRGFGSSN